MKKEDLPKKMEEDDMDDDSDDDDMVSEEFNQILWAHNYDINGRKNKVMIFLLFVLALIQSLVLGDINNNTYLSGYTDNSITGIEKFRY